MSSEIPAVLGLVVSLLDAMESFAGADGMRPWLIAVVVSMAVLSVAFVALRLIGRRLMRQRMWWDDWMILISVASNQFLKRQHPTSNNY